MSKLTNEQIKQLADVSKIEMTDEEVETFTEQLNGLWHVFDQLAELDTTNVEPTTHVLNMKNVMREDQAEKGLPVDEVMKNVPEHQDGLIKVPTIIE